MWHGDRGERQEEWVVSGGFDQRLIIGRFPKET